MTVVRLCGGPWDGDTIQFQPGQTYVVAPDHAREYVSDGRYVLDDDKRTASWREEQGSWSHD